MNDLITRLISDVGGPAPQTPLEVAEVLWLLQAGVESQPALSGQEASSRSPKQTEDRGVAKESAEAGGHAGPMSGSAPVEADRPTKDPGERTLVGTPGAGLGGRKERAVSTVVSIKPRAKEQGDVVLMDRALHRLGTREPSGRPILDLAATLNMSARRGGRPFPILSRANGPSGRLVVIEDQAIRLAPFRDEVQQLVVMARRGMKFRQVIHQRVSLALPDMVDSSRPWSSLGGEGPLVVLLVEDGFAAALHGGGLARWLRAAPAGAVVAWMHPGV